MCHAFSQLRKLKAKVKCMQEETKIQKMVIEQLNKLHESTKCQHVKSKVIATKYKLVYSMGLAKPNLPKLDIKTQNCGVQDSFFKKMVRTTDRLQTKFGVPRPRASLNIDKLDLMQQELTTMWENIYLL